MPKSDESQEEALKRLDRRLGVAEAAQARQMSPDAHAAMAQGYRFVGEVVGGVLGGVGLGWLVDRFAHTQPWGVVGGLLAGTGLSIFTAVSTATKASKQELAKFGTPPAAPDDEDKD
ncbi:MAG TPA: AtpZ/AtpI family protein [Phenylobacterium sp.]|nr:AtpZ/AtpI family protein [Phenylobacterium sp.]